MILLPRPAPHLPRTVEALHAAGFQNLQPLALSHPQPLPLTLPPTTTALILTSRFGVPEDTPYRHLPTYCVGGCTSKAATNAGFNVAYTGNNNAETMALALTQHSTLNTKHHFAHLHGDHANLDWHTTLTAAGHTVTPLLAYHTNRISALPSDFINPTITLLFSAGSASHLANLMKQANIPVNGTVIALSPAVAQAATAWPHIITPPAPTLEGMIQALLTLDT